MPSITTLFGLIIALLISIIFLISNYILYKKAHKKGWEALIPIYNTIVMIQIAQLPIWYIVLFFIPFANIYAMFKIYIEIAHKFGKSTGFGVLMVFFPFIYFPILAFGKTQYQGSLSSTIEYNSSITPNNNQSANLEQDNVISSLQVNESITMNDNFASVSEDQSDVIVDTLETSTIDPVIQETSNIVFVDDTLEENSNVQANKKFCPKCGNQVDQNDAICFMCGNKF